MEGVLVRDQKKDTILYAGVLSVRITDWFFLKEKPELKYIGLEDAIVKMQRDSAIWNYQFIMDYFNDSSTNKKKSSQNISIDLKEVDLKNISFSENDLWRGERMIVRTRSLHLNADHINFTYKIFQVNDLQIDNPYFYILNMPSRRPDSLKPRDDADTGLQLNTADMFIKVKKMQIHNGTISVQADEGKPDPGFDGSHLFITSVNGKFSNTIMQKDTIRSEVDINAKERCGLELKRLKAEFRVTPQIMEFAKLDLQTNKSKIGDYYAMCYSSFNKNFSYYISQVTMKGHIRDAKVNSDDIAYFAPAFKSWKKEVQISGTYDGTVQNFNVKNFLAKAGNTTYVSGEFSMNGLPDIYKTKIGFNNGIIRTNYNDAAIFAPVITEVHVPNLSALGDIFFRGNFNGTILDFSTSGTIGTAIGALSADVSLELPNGQDAVYAGSLTTTHFDIGKFLNYDLLGLVDFKGKISGNNFSIDKIRTTILGNISSLVFNDYTYTDINTNGTFQKKYFNGEVTIGDPNLDFKSHVEVDLTSLDPSFNILGDLKTNLKPLHLFKNDLQLTGLIDVNFTGKDIDHFLGSAKFLNADITSNDIRLGFDSLSITSSFKDSVKSIHLANNEFTANIDGVFNIKDLPDNFQAFLHQYYPAYIPAPSISLKKQAFSVELTTNFIEPYLKLYDKKIVGFNNIIINGNVDTKKDSFALNALIPYAGYAKYAITGAEINGKGNLKSLELKGNISSVQVSDSLSFPNSIFYVKSGNDHSIVSLKTSANNTLNEADLNGEVFTLNDGIRIKFDPSSFILNDKKWHLEKEGEISVTKEFVSAQNVKFIQGFQEITVETNQNDDPGQNNLVVNLKNIVIGDITTLLFKNPKLEGIASGSVYLNDFYGNFNIDAAIKAEQCRLDDDSIGLLSIKSGFNSQTGIIPFEVTSLNKGYHLEAIGNYNTKDTLNRPLHINALLDNTRITYLNKLLVGIFSNMDGLATGKLEVKGNPNAPEFTGKVKLHDAHLKVDYTQVNYKIDSADIRFDDGVIDFGEFNIYDLYKNKGIVKGKLYETGFRDLKFDFSLVTDKLMMLDTKQKDNPQFYGKAIGKAKLVFKGPESDCIMNIQAEANDTSHIYILNAISKEGGDEDFIVFKKYGTEIEKNETTSNFNLLVDLDLTANRKVQIDVILDPLSGDVIKATGNGRLKIKVGTIEPLSIRGKYDIDNGKYDFSFQSFIKKPFILKQESGNYLEWTGDPLNAFIHIDAIYTAENVSISDLISNQISAFNNSGSKAYRGPVYVIATLSDKLSKPTIHFKLDFPQSSPLKSDAVFEGLLNKIEEDDNEILKQVTYLIVFDMFAPYGQGNGANLNVTTLSVNTVSQVINNELNKTLSNLLFRITHDKNLHFDVGTSVYNSNDLFSNLTTGSGNNTAANNIFDRSRVNVKLGYNFNDKFTVSFGGDFDFNLGATTQSGNFQWLPDLNVEYYLTKDKKLRGVIFSKNSLNINGTTLGKQNRQGVGISYRKDFERIFAKKKKRQLLKLLQIVFPTIKITSVIQDRVFLYNL